MEKYEIEPFDWHYKLNQLSIELKNKVANVEVTGENFGDELENCEMHLMKVSYDNQNDILEVMFDELNHLIESPLMICFQQHQDIIEAIVIYDNNDNKNVIFFNGPSPLMNYE
jgi:hypothetical protein